MPQVKFFHQCDAPAPGVPGRDGKTIKAKSKRFAQGAVVDASELDPDWLEGAIREEFVGIVEEGQE